MADISEFLKGISSILWPLLAILVAIQLIPTLRELIKSRGVKIKVGDMEVSIEQATKSLEQQIADVQSKILELEKAQQRFPVTTSIEPTASSSDKDRSEYDEEIPASLRLTPKVSKCILWVDDSPKNNAFLIARLERDEFEVTQALTTSQALRHLEAAPKKYRLVITDMGREEGDEEVPDAGIQLLSSMRRHGISLPIVVYTSRRGVNLARPHVNKDGFLAATTSSTDLLFHIYSQFK